MKLPMYTRWFGQPISTVVSAGDYTYTEAVALTDETWLDGENRQLNGEVVRRISEAGVPFLDLYWDHTE